MPIIIRVNPKHPRSQWLVNQTATTSSNELLNLSFGMKDTARKWPFSWPRSYSLRRGSSTGDAAIRWLPFATRTGSRWTVSTKQVAGRQFRAGSFTSETNAKSVISISPSARLRSTRWKVSGCHLSRAHPSAIVDVLEKNCPRGGIPRADACAVDDYFRKSIVRNTRSTSLRESQPHLDASVRIFVPSGFPARRGSIHPLPRRPLAGTDSHLHR